MKLMHANSTENNTECNTIYRTRKTCTKGEIIEVM